MWARGAGFVRDEGRDMKTREGLGVREGERERVREKERARG